MTPRYVGESQRAYVERILRDEGRLATYDALYHLAFEDGRKCSITRLAAIVRNLREDGWGIANEAEQGALAVYALRRVSIPAPVAAVPDWAAGWRCTDCGSRPASQPAALLGDLGRAFCGACKAQRYFRTVAA